ncbi:MAG TPA: NF038130 family PEP-CTERM protein [Cyanophyceae cyanobacterium]
MAGAIQKLLIGASVIAGTSAIATSPAFAISLTGASVTGVKGVDYFLYERVSNPNSATTDFTVLNNGADLQTVLEGSCSVGGQFIPSKSCKKGEPGGNVELFANSETLSLNAFLGYTKATSLSGNLGSKSITLSSLTAKDWFGSNLDTSYGAKNLANEWFNAALSAYNVNDNLLGLLGLTKAGIFNAALNNGVFQRFSDPNIAYVSQDDATSKLEVGLIGHFNALDLVLGYLDPSDKQLLSFYLQGKPVQASELVKITYDGETKYHYSFSAAKSGLREQGDQVSHTGIYDPQLTSDTETESVPEPSAILGLIGVGGLFAAKRKLQKA